MNHFSRPIYLITLAISFVLLSLSYYLKVNTPHFFLVLAGITLLSIGIIFLVHRMGRGSKNAIDKTWILPGFSAFILIMASFSILIFETRKKAEANKTKIAMEAHTQMKINEANLRSDNMLMVDRLFNKIEEQLKTNLEGVLSDNLILEISATSHMLHPEGYDYMDTDSITQQAYSKERGWLLMNILNADINPESMDSIIAITSFAGADLGGVDLSDKDLRGIDLKRANLKRANLQSTILDNADLRGACLWNANLNQSSIQKALLNRADLRWAEMDRASLFQSDFSGGHMMNAKIRGADLSQAKFRLANLSSALLNESNLEEANLTFTILINANLNNAKLNAADMRYAEIIGCNIKNVNLTNADLENMKVENTNWLKRLESWEVIGRDGIMDDYIITKDKASKELRYELLKKEQEL
jgi:uncharacterized protein YjbI with pentapeptide repeats